MAVAEVPVEQSNRVVLEIARLLEEAESRRLFLGSVKDSDVRVQDALVILLLSSDTTADEVEMAFGPEAEGLARFNPDTPRVVEFPRSESGEATDPEDHCEVVLQEISRLCRQALALRVLLRSAKYADVHLRGGAVILVLDQDTTAEKITELFGPEAKGLARFNPAAPRVVEFPLQDSESQTAELMAQELNRYLSAFR